MSHQHSGSCLCGAVQFQLVGDFQSFFLCHCSRCQKGSGSAHGANLFAKDSLFTWLQGETHVKTYQHPNSLHAKSFCQNCGAALPTVAEHINCVVVPAGSLDSVVPIPPTAKIFVAYSASWASHINDVPSFDELPNHHIKPKE